MSPSPQQDQILGELIPIGGGDCQVLTAPTVSVGRASGNDLVLPFSNISSRHCRLVLSEGYWYVQDQGSTNGVRVNGIKVTDRRIDPGDTLTIARQQFVIKYSPERLGATGIPPREVLSGDAVFQESLMQKAGLAAKSKVSSNKAGADVVAPADEEFTPAATAKRSYFDDLTF